MNQFLAADAQAAPSSAPIHKRWTVFVDPRHHAPLHGQVDSIPACPSPKVHEREQLLARFIYSFCPSDVAALKQSERLHHYWVQVLPGLGGSSDILDAAISSLSTAYLGQMEGDVALQKQAISLYGRALHELSKVTTAPGFRADDHTLASIMCLGMSEVRRQMHSMYVLTAAKWLICEIRYTFHQWQRDKGGSATTKEVGSSSD